MKKMLLNALSVILSKKNYEKVKNLNKNELKKIVGLYHKLVKEFDGNTKIAKYYTNNYVEKGYVSEFYLGMIELLNKKIELHKKAIERLEKMRDYYATQV